MKRCVYLGMGAIFSPRHCKGHCIRGGGWSEASTCTRKGAGRRVACIIMTPSPSAYCSCSRHSCSSPPLAYWSRRPPGTYIRRRSLRVCRTRESADVDVMRLDPRLYSLYTRVVQCIVTSSIRVTCSTRIKIVLYDVVWQCKPACAK